MSPSSPKKRYFAKLLSSVINGLLTLAVTAMVPRALGPSSYGAFTFLTTFFAQIISFFDVGSSIAFYTKLSKRQSEKAIIGFYFLFIVALFLVCLLLLYVSLIPGIKEHIYAQNGSLFIVAGFWFGFLTWISQIAIRISDAYAMTVDVEIIKTIHRVFFFLVIVAMTYYDILSLGSFFGYHFLLLGSFILILGIYFYRVGILEKKIFFLGFADIKRYVREFYSYSHPLLVGTIVSTISGLAVLWVLQQFYGNGQMGYYGFAYQIAAACFVFTAALTPIITREFAVSHQSGDLERMAALFLRYIPMLYSVAAFFSVFLAVHADAIATFVGGTAYIDATTVVALMALYPIHQTYGQLSGSVFYATENTKLSRNISIVSGLIFLLFGVVLLLPDRYFGFEMGAVGFAISMVATQIIAVNIQLYFNAKFLRLNMRHFVFHQIYSLLLFYGLAATSAVFAPFGSPLLDFLLSGFIYTCLVIISAYFFPQVFATNRDEIKMNLQKVVSCVAKK